MKKEYLKIKNRTCPILWTSSNPFWGIIMHFRKNFNIDKDCIHNNIVQLLWDLINEECGIPHVQIFYIQKKGFHNL